MPLDGGPNSDRTPENFVGPSADATSNGTSASKLTTNGVVHDTSVHWIADGRTDGRFGRSVTDLSQPSDLALSSSTPFSFSLVEGTHQTTSPSHDANDHTVGENLVNSNPLLGTTPHSPSSHGRPTDLSNLLGDSSESRHSPKAMGDPMDVSGPSQDNSPMPEIPLEPMRHGKGQLSREIVLPSLELPHHPLPFLDNTVSETMGEASVHDEVSPTEDFVMRDTPKSPGKIARGREDAAEEEPAAKRSRTELDASQTAQFKVPELPQNSSRQVAPLPSTPIETSGAHLVMIETPSGQNLSQPLTKAQHRFLQKAIQNVRRTKDAGPFNKPVDPIALGIPSYPDVIKQPMDLSTIETNLKDDRYSSADDCIRDFQLVIQNSITFNGIDHLVAQAALRVKTSFEKHIANLPGPGTMDLTPSDKKSKKAAAASKIAPSRRESRSSLGGNARSPSATASQQTFALGPQGVPLIRRDSTAQDGRPKREIHPPAPRDLPYANQKPKKKKYQLELRFCQEVLTELKKAKYQSLSWPFAQPVDPVALNIPHYHNVIKKPMDLSTIDKKLTAGQYENAREFEADVGLMFNNCYKFNPDGNAVHRLGKDFEEIFTEKWAEKKQYLEDHTVPSGPQTPGTSPEPQYDEEEEEEEPEDEITALQKQIAAMSKQVELIQKKKGSPPVSGKKPTKGSKASKKESKKAPNVASVKSEKRAATKPTKKEKIPYVTYEQKQDISNRINNLPAPRMATALTIIRDNMPNLKVIEARSYTCPADL